MSIAKIIGKISLSEKQYEKLKNLGVTDIYSDNPSSRSDIKEIINRVGNAEAIIINISTPITREVIKKCINLKFIQTWSTGMDNIDIDAAQEAGIIVKNVPDFSIEAVAEKTVCMLIFIASQMREANIDAISGNWNYTKFQGVELKGKTLGIIGKGKIGARVEELANVLGMKVLSANSSSTKDTIKEILSLSDFVTLHCPLTEKTKYLIGTEEFNAMKKGIFLVNNSRGGVVDEKALLKALESEIVAYASIDVLEKEPPSPDNPLINHPKVFLTPHVTWNTEESIEKLSEVCIENLAQYLSSAP